MDKSRSKPALQSNISILNTNDKKLKQLSRNKEKKKKTLCNKTIILIMKTTRSPPPDPPPPWWVFNRNTCSTNSK